MEKPRIRKQPWDNKSRKDVIRGSALTPNSAIESRYYLHLTHLINQMTQETESQIKKLFDSEPAQEFFAQDKSLTAQARIVMNALTQKFDTLFATQSKPLSTEMATEENKSSDVALQSSLKQISSGLTLPRSALTGRLSEILGATIAENVSLIKSIPAKYLDGVQGAVMRSITTGNGMQDLVPYLKKHKGITLRRARFIAMDQTRKAFENMSTARMQDAGLDEFEWLHTGGSNHPRHTHQAMSGKIFKLNEGAYDSAVKEYVMPGQLPGCRCRKVTVIRIGKKSNG